MKGVWDSIHVVEVQEAGKNGVYSLTSTVMLSIRTKAKVTGLSLHDCCVLLLFLSLALRFCFPPVRCLPLLNHLEQDTGSMALAGSLTRQANGEFPVDQVRMFSRLLFVISHAVARQHNTHIKNIGRMIEVLPSLVLVMHLLIVAL